MPMGWMKANDNKEEYKGLFKLFLQWSNCARGVYLLAAAFVLISGAFLPAAEAKFFVTGNSAGYNTDSGTAIRNEGKTTTPSAPTINQGEFTITYFKQKRSAAAIIAGDTQYGVIAAADSPAPRPVIAVYGDTLIALGGAGNGAVNDTILYNAVYDSFGLVYDTIYLSIDTVGLKDTLNYIFSVTNYANTFDTIGLIVDTAWSRYGSDTFGNFQYQFFDSKGAALTGILYGAQEDTGKLGLGPNASETVMLRIYTATNVAGDTVRAAIRAYANNTTGRIPGSSTSEVFSYTGFNGINYGGDGNDAAFIEVTASGPVIRYAKSDTVFAPLAVYTGTGYETQVYVPGSLIVYTIWFENDGNDTSDTIIIDDWIDTRYLRFDSAGLSQLQGQTQVSAAGRHIDSGYGSIFRDSGMPNIGTGFRVKLYYSAGAATPVTPLTKSTRLEDVGRVRWEIARTGGVVGASNGDDVNNVDILDVTPGLTAADVDRGYVRFSVVIR